jgi:hypothetical protein
MKNKDKYTTIKERDEAFNSFCKVRPVCDDCPVRTLSIQQCGRVSCGFAWLELEAEKSSKEMIEELTDTVNTELYGSNIDRHLFDEEVQAIIKMRDKIKAVWAKQDVEEEEAEKEKQK